MNPLSKVTVRAFFGRYGSRLRPIQQAATENLCRDRDGLIIAGTGAGKTEAVFAPIADALVSHSKPRTNVSVLVVSPTRALASDLYERLSPTLNQLGLRIDVETGDRKTGSKSSVSDFLIKTPEGLDSSLTRQVRDLHGVRFVIIDEIHSYVASPRGTQMAGILSRLHVIAPKHVRWALSATVDDPKAFSAMKLLRNPVIVEGQHVDDFEFHDIRWADASDKGVSFFLTQLREIGLRKAIGFASSKRKVEEIVVQLNAGWLKGAVWAHHAGLSSKTRREMEQAYRTRKAGLLVATTTMELGVDIGDIDSCILFDVPPDVAALRQRAGRAGRRSGIRRLVCVLSSNSRAVDYGRLRLALTESAPAAMRDGRFFLAGVIQQCLAYVGQYHRASAQEIEEFMQRTFDAEPMLANLVINVLVDSRLLRNADCFFELGELATQDLASNRLFLTFGTGFRSNSGGGLPEVSSGSSRINAEAILRNGRGGRGGGLAGDLGSLTQRNAGPSPPAFGSNSVSVFEALAGKHLVKFGGRFRI